MLRRRIVALGLLLSVSGGLSAQDRITFLDRASRSPAPLLRNGTITSEDPGKVVFTNDNRRSDVPAGDVLDVQYEGEPTIEMNAARAAERDRKLDAALAAYGDALKKVTPDKRFIRRHIEYKLAELRVTQAEAGGAAAPAIDALRAFYQKNPDGRQTLACLEHLGRLLITSRQPAAEVIQGLNQVRSTFGGDNRELANRCDLLRNDLLALEVEMLYTKDPQAAKGKAEETAKTLAEMARGADRAVAGELAAREQFCRAIAGASSEALTAWENQLKGPDDPRARAAVHLARGDYFRLMQKHKEAMWDYLWVDTVYFAEREQQAKALYHLIEVFEKIGDSPKSRESRERLTADARLKDTRYQRLAGK